MKGQVTLFVVLGLVIVIIAGLALFVIPKSNEDIKLEIQESDEIYSLVKQCLADTSKEAIILIGQNSGYISTEDLDIEEDLVYPTKGNFLTYPPGKLPYWYYVDDESGITSSFKPPLCARYPCILPRNIGPGSIQQQIERFVSEKIVDCASLEAYEGRVDVERDLPIIRSDIAEDVVIMTAYWPHNISLNELKDQFDEVIVTHDIKLASAYKLNELIAYEEQYGNHFSSQTMSMISAYSGMDQALPPITATDFSLFGGKKIWISENIKSDIKNQILPLMELFQVKHSKYYSPYNTESVNSDFREGIGYNTIHESNNDQSIFVDGVYSGFDIGFGSSEEDNKAIVNGLATEFHLPLVEPQISINDGQQLVTGEEISGAPDLIMKLMGLGITRYKATYTIAYPMIFRAVDEDAFGGEGFEFLSAFEVNIRNNKATDLPFNEPVSSMSDAGEGISLYRFDDRPFVVNVYNKYDNSPIVDATVSYICVEDHYLGRTDSEGKVVGQIPFCELGGRIEVFHPAYSDSTISYDHDGSQNEIDVRIWSIQEMEVIGHSRYIENMNANPLELPVKEEIDPESEYLLVVLEPMNQTWPPVQVINIGDTSGLDTSLRDLYENENVEQFDDFEIPEDFSLGINGSAPNFINIVPGDYKITALLLHTVPFTIPEEEDCALFGAIGCSEYPETTFDAWPKGGMSMETEFFPEQIYSGKTMDVVVQEIKKLENWEMLRDTPDEPLIPPYVWDEDYTNTRISKIEFVE